MRLSVALSVTLIPQLFGQVTVFDVASIRASRPETPNIGETRPGGVLILRNESVVGLIQMGWGTKPFQLEGAAPWLRDRYDIDAKAEGGGEMSAAELRVPMQALLKERFGLRYHMESRAHEVYALVVAKNGPNFKHADKTSESSYRETWRQIILHRKTMAQFADALSYLTEIRAPVSDSTGLTGEFDLTLDFFPEAVSPPPQLQGEGATAANRPPPESRISVFTALQEELGLKLAARKGTVEVLVIDHIERPSAN
jgi:uncharacterized protein (TIGR03435 family)